MSLHYVIFCQVCPLLFFSVLRILIFLSGYLVFDEFLPLFHLLLLEVLLIFDCPLFWQRFCWHDQLFVSMLCEGNFVYFYSLLQVQSAYFLILLHYVSFCLVTSVSIYVAINTSGTLGCLSSWFWFQTSSRLPWRCSMFCSSFMLMTRPVVSWLLVINLIYSPSIVCSSSFVNTFLFATFRLWFARVENK